MTILFESVLTDKIKLKPIQLGRNMKDILSYHIQKKFQGTCSHHGYILENSIEIEKYSAGKIIDLSLNGDIEYNVTYKAVVCNPLIGSLIDIEVVNKNKFGILGKTNVMWKNSKYDVLEIIVPEHISNEISNYNIGDKCKIEVLGKKFELNDKKISVIGKFSTEEKIVLKQNNETLLRAPSVMSDSDSIILNDESDDPDEENVDDNNEENVEEDKSDVSSELLSEKDEEALDIDDEIISDGGSDVGDDDNDDNDDFE